MSTKRLITLLAALFLPVYSYALDVGFEAFIGADGSDNINADNKGSELEGGEARFTFSVFGVQSSRRVEAAFDGEFITERQFDDEDTDTGLSTITNFFGAANIQITPRNLSWYVGDAIGTVLEDGELQSVDNEGVRRNVFVTGPELNFDIDGDRTLATRFLYLHQSDDTDDELATLYNFNSRFESRLQAGHRWGFGLSDIYSDNPDEQFGTDINRLSASVFWGRKRGLVDTVIRLGATQYDAEGDAVTGLLASFDWIRTLSSASTLSFSVGHDLVDENLNSVESLTSTGTATENDLDGVSQDTTVSLTYKAASGVNTLTVGVGALNSEFQRNTSATGFSEDVLGLDDRRRYSANLALARQMTVKWYTSVGASYIQEDFTNRSDETDSLVLSASATYKLSRSWSFLAGLVHGQEEGLETEDVVQNAQAQPFDRTENRITFGLKWKPPSKVSSATTFKLKSLLN